MALPGLNSLVTLAIEAIVVGLIVWLVFYAMDRLGAPQPVRIVVMVIIIIFLLLALVAVLRSLGVAV